MLSRALALTHQKELAEVVQVCDWDACWTSVEVLFNMSNQEEALGQTQNMLELDTAGLVVPYERVG